MTQRTTAEFVAFLKENQEGNEASIDLLEQVFYHTDPLIDDCKYAELAEIAEAFVANSIEVEVCISLLINLCHVKEYVNDAYCKLRNYIAKLLLSKLNEQQTQRMLTGL